MAYSLFALFYNKPDIWASLIAQLVKNQPVMQETWFDSRVRKIHWRRDRVPTPVFLGFPCGSAGKESACNAGDLGRFPWRRERLPTPVFWTGEFHGLYSPWGHKELDTAEWFHFHNNMRIQINSNLVVANISRKKKKIFHYYIGWREVS